MSTKIYNGRRLLAGNDVFDFSRKLRATMEPVRERLDAEMIINKAVTLYDEALAGTPIAEGCSPIGAALSDYIEHQDAADPHTREHDPHRFEVSFGRDPEIGRIVCLVFCEQEVFMEALDEMAEVRDYAYWDNSDPDPDVSAREWQERKAAWGRVMPTGVPAESMLNFTLCTSSQISVLHLFNPNGTATPLAVHEAINNAPGRDDRAIAVARRRIQKLQIHPFDGTDVWSYLRRLDDHAARVAPKIVHQMPMTNLEGLHSTEITPSISSDLDDLIRAAA